VVAPVVVNRSTTYSVPVVVPLRVALLPTKPERPVEEIEKLCETSVAAL
jgi:hypothetical protein